MKAKIQITKLRSHENEKLWCLLFIKNRRFKVYGSDNFFRENGIRERNALLNAFAFSFQVAHANFEQIGIFLNNLKVKMCNVNSKV